MESGMHLVTMRLANDRDFTFYMSRVAATALKAQLVDMRYFVWREGRRYQYDKALVNQTGANIEKADFEYGDIVAVKIEPARD